MVFEHVSLQGILVAFMEPTFHSGSSEQLSGSGSNKGKKNNPPMRCSTATMTKDEIEYNSCLKNPSMLQSNAAKITASGGMIFFNMA